MSALNETQRKQFERDGYVVVDGILDLETDVPLLEEEYGEVLEREVRRLHSEGKISETYDALPFLERFSRVLSEGVLPFQPFDMCFPPQFDEDTPIHLSPSVFHRVLRNPRILEIVEDLIGPEIYSNAVQHIRIKPPQRTVPDAIHNPLIAATGWHQDLGVIDAEADQSEVISVWVAVTEATVENGCLVVIPGSHRAGLAPHCPEGEKHGNHHPVTIPKEFRNDSGARALPMRAGSAVFFQKTLMHSALPNESDTVRWSFDLRYNPIGQPNGRSWYPGFVARSRAHPETELTDARAWAELWREARSRLVRTGVAGRPFTRWSPDHPGCA